MNVRQLIELLQQCDPVARIVMDCDGLAEEITIVERSRNGDVELRADCEEYAEELCEIGRDLLFPT